MGGMAVTGLPSWSVGKNLPAMQIFCIAGDMGSISGWGRCPGGGHGNPFQYSCRESPVGRGVLWAVVQGVTESQTQWRAT